MERSGKTGAKEPSVPEKALDYYKHHTQTDNLSKYFCGSNQKLDWNVSVDIPKITVDIPKITVDIPKITIDDTTKNPSPTSSVASNKKLEWDSGADIGYANCHNRSIHKSASLPILNISGIVRPSDSECATSEDEKRSSDTPRTDLLKFISRKVGVPIAESTPYGRRSDPILHEIPGKSEAMNLGRKSKGKLGVAVFNFEIQGGEDLDEAGRKGDDLASKADSTLQYFERYREIKQRNLHVTKPSYVECTGAANVSVAIQTSMLNRASTSSSSPPSEQKQKNVSVELTNRESNSSSSPTEQRHKNTSVGLTNRETTSSSSSPPEQKQTSTATNSDIAVSSSKSFEYLLAQSKVSSAKSGSSSSEAKNMSAEANTQDRTDEDSLSSSSEHFLTDFLSKTNVDAAETERNLKLLQKLLKSKKYNEETKRYYLKKILRSMLSSSSDASEKATPKVDVPLKTVKSVRTTSYPTPSGEIKYTAYSAPKENVEVRYRTRDYTTSTCSSSPNELFVPKSIMPDKSWKQDKTLSEILLDRKSNGGGDDHVLTYANRERDVQLNWINTEIEHLTKLRTILERNSGLKKGGGKKSTTVYMVTTERPSANTSDDVKSSKLSSKSNASKPDDNNGAVFPGAGYYVSGETVVNISDCGCRRPARPKKGGLSGDVGSDHTARNKSTNTPYVGEDGKERPVPESVMGSIIPRETGVTEKPSKTAGPSKDPEDFRVPERPSHEPAGPINATVPRGSDDVRMNKGGRISDSRSPRGSAARPLVNSKNTRDTSPGPRMSASNAVRPSHGPWESDGASVHFPQDRQLLEGSGPPIIEEPNDYVDYVLPTMEDNREPGNSRPTTNHPKMSRDSRREPSVSRGKANISRSLNTPSSVISADPPRISEVPMESDERRRGTSNAAPSYEPRESEERRRGTSNAAPSYERSRDPKERKTFPSEAAPVNDGLRDPEEWKMCTPKCTCGFKPRDPMGSHIPMTDKSVGTLNENQRPVAPRASDTLSIDKSVGTLDAQQPVDQAKKSSEDVQPPADANSQTDVYVNEAVVVANEIVCKAHDGGPVRRIVVEVPMKSSKSCKCYKQLGGVGTSVTPSSSSSDSSGSLTSSNTNVPLCACCRKCIPVSDTSFDLNDINSSTNPSPVFCGPCKAVSQNKALDSKNPYFNQPSHVCNCHDQTGKMSKIQSMLAELQQLEQSEEHCKYRYSKQHKKQASKAKKKSHKPIAYLLTFDGKQRPGPEGTSGEQPHEEIRIQLPSMKRNDEPIVEAPSVENYKKRRKSKNLQEYLESNKPDFIKAAEARRKCMIELAYLREQRCQKYKQLLAMTGNFPCSNSPNANTQQKRLFTTKEMKRITANNYKRLPEVQQKLLDNRNNQIKKANRLLADMFNKRLRDSVLKGKPSISASASVIKWA